MAVQPERCVLKQDMKYDREQFDRAIWAVVTSIPSGRVMSYGAVASAAGYPRYSRMVSKAMTRSPRKLPWHRVIRSDSTLAFAVAGEAYKKQSALLRKEGVKVVEGKVTATNHAVGMDLDQLLWGPATDE